jgi:hypothetical protein
MKTRILWLVVIAATIAGFYFFMIKPALAPPPAPKPSPLAGLKPAAMPPPELPAPVVMLPPAPQLPPVVVAKPRADSPSLQLEVPIADGATIDFSTGAPNVRSQGEDKAALERALREMAEATKNTTFPPSPEKK